MRFIVTGATSMVGAEFVNIAIEHGHEILAIVRNQSPHLKRLPESKLITLAFCSLKELDSIEFDGKKYDTFYHFGWDYTSREGRNNVVGQEENIKYTIDAVNMAKRFGCTTFVGAGSQSEYGIVDGKTDENTPLNPQIPYAIAKASAFLLSKSLCEQNKIKHIWARIYSVYGCYDHGFSIINETIKSFFQNKSVNYSSGTQMWNFIHQRDAAQMFLLIAEKDIEQGVYLIANKESFPLKYYLQILISKLGEGCKYSFGNVEGYGLNPDMEKTIKALQMNTFVPFEQGIDEVIENARNIK